MLQSIDRPDDQSPSLNDTGVQSDDTYQLLRQLGEKLSDLTRDYQRLVPDCSSPAPNAGAFRSALEQSMPPRRKLGELARCIYRSRRSRDRILPNELFGEPAWDLMLDLFASECEGRRISVTSACIAASVPPTTGLRWISVLITFGLVARDEDPADRRRAYIDLTPRGRSAMVEYLNNHVTN
jgi:hypothetical protein